MRWATRPKVTEHVAQKTRELVFETAKRYGIPPVFITAHIRHQAADRARKEVMRTMVEDFGLLRWQVAFMFGRDRRRVRASVLAVKDQPLSVKRRRRRVRLKPIPWQPVGNQFMWVFAVPLELQTEPVPVVARYMKPVPKTITLAADEKIALARFYERQAHSLRKSVAGIIG